ncbi:MAG: hypothetical protein RR547_06620 [Raoultibacter sp.]
MSSELLQSVQIPNSIKIDDYVLSNSLSLKLCINFNAWQENDPTIPGIELLVKLKANLIVVSEGDHIEIFATIKYTKQL